MSGTGLKGVGSSTHAAPFHASASGAFPLDPTAMHARSDAHDTL